MAQGLPSGCTAAPLRAALREMAPAGLQVGCRAIRDGDEGRLLPEERQVITTRDRFARRASGAARHLARALLADLGHAGVAIGRRPSGCPVWPEGIVGSLAHDAHMAVAAVGRGAHFRGIGIDVEPAEPLPEDVAALARSVGDRLAGASPELAGRLLFALKEACYKAVYPRDGVMLEFQDIAVDLPAGRATTRTGHAVRLYWRETPRVVALAVVVSA
ncbi:4'-phosphopantetheinyl transferase superfamily protein [Xanthobacter sp. KR7-225]|uniref:4'-phosphopantetheinyl transferase family protein n=1 Tax=Xanthobacter sp. KR7-225 TaxID=3156613 RepID=UPI0032B3864C